VQHVGRVPEVGATVMLDGFRFIVREANETHVMKVEIIRAEAPTSAPKELSEP
jgi:CBS domain containing-hemolysin-like protein